MVNVAIQEKYITTLAVFGDLQQTIDQAVQRYTVEKITEKIAELQERLKNYQTHYGMDYPSFAERIATDEQFIASVEREKSKTWELDLADWEFCHKGITDWTRKLTTILLS